MKRLFSIVLCSALCLSMFAVPARPGKRLIQQPDGTTIEAYVHGDEVHHFTTDAQGNLLVKNENGFLVRSNEKVNHKAAAERRAARAQKRQLRHRTPAAAAASHDKGLVILVEFSDKSFQSGNTHEAFDQMLNGDTYTYGGATGSVRQYYSDQSSGAFQPDLVVYGPVQLSNNYSDYGSNDSQGNDKYCGKMIAEACQLAVEQYNIDLSEFDLDNNGYVDFVDILYAGYGEADSNDSNTIWPCEWFLSESDYGQELSIGGKKIDTFSCHQELDGKTRKRAGIGTACHELGHVFGLPDVYSYDVVTVGEWDLMDGGAYLNDGNTPPAFSGYERMCSGWAKATVLNEAADNVELKELQGSQEIYIITSTGKHNLSGTSPNPKDFYILENRQNTGWDTYLPGHGMLIWHLQYNKNYWDLNMPNGYDINFNTGEYKSTKHQYWVIIPADGKVNYELYEGAYYTSGDSGDPYPGTKKVTSFSDLPADWQITEIAEANSLISFKFSSKNGEPPVGGKSYVKMTELPEDLSGNYLIVYEEGSLALDGSLTTIDAIGNYQSLTIEGNKISGSADYSFNIAKVSGGYTIQSASGLYIGNDKSDANFLKASSETAYVNTISAGEDGVDIVSSNTYLRYNAASNQTRFRYYKEASYKNQKPVVLYKLDATSAVDEVKANFVITAQNGQISLRGLSQNAKVAVYNIAGALVYSDFNAAHSTDINVNSGIYLVRVEDAGNTVTRKIIVE